MADNQDRRSIITRPLRRWSAIFRGVKADSGASARPSSPTRSCINDLDFGVSVDNHNALKVTAYYAGIRIIGENFAGLPVSVKEWGPKGVMSAPDHRVNRLLHNPNGYTNGFLFFQTLSTWLKDWGNAFALIERDRGGNPVALHQVHPAGVRVVLVGKGKKYYDIRFQDTALSHLNGIYPTDDVIHVMEVSLDGLKGLNPIYLNAGALEKSLAQEKFAADFYRKGGNIRAVMETEGSLGDDKYSTWMKHMAEASANFDTPLLEYGIKYKQLDVNPVAAQLLQSETMSIQDVCRILGVPPHMLAELSHATFSNIEHQTIQFVQYTLRPLVKRFEVELESKLFFEDERGRYSIDFSLEGLLRGDTAARSSYYHNAILDGYLSRNEVRALEGYEHKDGLDDMLYPANEGVVGKEDPNKNNE